MAKAPTWAPLDAASDELATAMAPAPEDFFEELSVNAALYYAEQAAYAALAKFTAIAGTELMGGEEVPEGVQRVLAAWTEGCGMLDAALVELGVLPAEALEP